MVNETPATIQYLNTDLDLCCPNDLRSLNEYFENCDLHSLHCEQSNNSHWTACFESDHDYFEPEQHIAAMLESIESAPPPVKHIWDLCTLREFNIGYDSGDKPWAFNQGLTNQTLNRLAGVGASLRITIYPPYPPKD